MRRKGRAIAGSPPRGSIFVDSSAWIAFFSARDQHHADADVMFRRAAESGTGLFTTNLVLAEIHRLLLYRAGIAAAAAALERIDASALVKIAFAGIENHRAARAWLNRLSHLPISYADAVSFAVMEASGCKEAISFDHHFRLAGFALRRPRS